MADPSDPALGPVEGVMVAVDTTSGDRLETVSGADGLAVFALDPEAFAGAIDHVVGRSFTYLSRDSSIDGLRKGWAPYVWSWPLVLAARDRGDRGGVGVVLRLRRGPAQGGRG